MPMGNSQVNWNKKQKEGKNEKVLYIHSDFNGNDSLHNVPGPDT